MSYYQPEEQPLTSKSPASGSSPNSDPCEPMFVNPSHMNRKPVKSLSRRTWLIILGLIALLLLLLLILLITTSYYAASYAQCRKNSTAMLDDSLENEKSVPIVRLPLNVLPVTYNVKLKIDMNQIAVLPFYGSVSIDIDCLEATNVIYLHCGPKLELKIDQVKLYQLSTDKYGDALVVSSSNNDNQIKIVKLEYNKDAEWYLIRLDRELGKGHRFRLETGNFNSTLYSNHLKGLYTSPYKDNGIQKQMAASQMQPIEARRVFPCFDEPAFKSLFKISITRPINYTALANMPLAKTTQLDANWAMDEFERTVIMPTYLLAFLVTQYESKSIRDDKGRTFRVWAPSDKIHLGNYALDVGPKILSFFENYFAIDYPLNKTDMVSITQFYGGAMENWGLITFRESSMLWDEAQDTGFERRRIYAIIAHELAHQWFGNLVTLKWWDDLWLNEGFSTFGEMLAVRNFEQINRIGEDPATFENETMDISHLTEIAQRAFQTDSSSKSRPIYEPIEFTNGINNNFGTITYSKGASIVRMIEATLGRDTFKQAMHDYLVANQYGNVATNDLWTSLSKATETWKDPIDFKSVMTSWVDQKNFPLVTVKRTSPSSFEVEQSRFLLSKQTKEAEEEIFWQIPLMYASEIIQDWSKPDIYWLKSKKQTIDIPSAPDPSWYLFNVDQAGYFRVNYDNENWEKLKTQLLTNHEVIPYATRVQLLDDLTDLVSVGKVKISLLLDISLYLKKERDVAPWLTITGFFQTLFRAFALQPSFGQLQTYLGDLLDEPFNQVDWNLIEESSEARGVIPVGLRDVVYCIGIQRGGQEEWQFAFQSTNFKLFRQLGCSRQLPLLNKFLDHITMKLYAKEVFNHLVDHTNPLIYSLLSRYTNDRQRRYIISNYLSAFTVYGLPTLEAARSMDNFPRQYKYAYNDFLTKVENLDQWMTFNKEGVEQWLNAKYPDNNQPPADFDHLEY